MPMTPAEIARHNDINAQLTAEDGIERLSWGQWGDAFRQHGPEAFTSGQKVAAVDSATPGTVVEVVDGRYRVRFPDVGGTFEYPVYNLRPWPLS